MSEKENTQFLGRTLFLGILQFVLLLLLLGRMYYLQIFEGNYYHLLAEGNRIATRPLIPLRGQIYDRHKSPLAQNEASFRAVLLTDKKDKIEEVLDTLSGLIALSFEEREEVLKLAQKKRGFDSIIVKDNLSWPEISAIELHVADLPGISIEVGSVRKYPEILNGAHLLGYIASPSEKEQEEDSMLTIPGLKVGKVGLEKYYDVRLRGLPGHSAFEVNAKRKIVRDLHQVASIPGEDVHLTLDARLQAYAQETLSSYESASAVVIDIQNGDILTLVSTPSFDPNLFPRGISHTDWLKLRDNPYVPLTNKAISGLYPPGSTLKPFVTLAALHSGVIDENSTIHCPGYMFVGTHKFHCYRKTGHGSVNFSRAVAESCDVFFYEIGKKVDIDLLSTVYQDFGLGRAGFEGLPHSKKGLVPTKNWKKEEKSANWTVSDTVQTSIGQGYMLATPLELVVAMARLAGGGKRLVPRLEDQGTVSFQDMGYEQKYIKAILETMNATVNKPSGTAFRWRIPIEGMEMAGKTGTSQVRRITLQQRKAGQTKTAHLPWKYREHGLFLGYAPAHKPRYAIVVVIEHAGGASLAVQAARDILLKAQFLEKETVL
ncbi:MAG: penicillin-binding protein 2 [Alphaproteobacteria bacterium]|nr:penicillin-binding protein 2 [Alphaproteobacteria bacterium]